MNNEIKKTLINCAGVLCGLCLLKLTLSVPTSTRTDTNPIKKVRSSVIFDYGDAINAVSHSDMFSRDIQKAIEHIPYGASSEFYKGIVALTKSSAFSSTKCESIVSMCSKIKED